MTNHNYNTPDEGAQNWHEPLNANFEQLDTDVELRDTAENLSEYEPRVGAKFLATDTGVVYLGVETENDAGDPVVEWRKQGVLTQGDSLANEVVSEFAAVYGGLDNRASAPRSVVLGGKSNLASGRSAIAAGKRARAVHDGAVVFGDHTSSTVSSRSTGEFRSQMPVHAPAFYTTSARASKTDLAPGDPQDALDGVEALSVRSWELDADADGNRHVGPMAGEFAEQFDLGGEDSIATVDADGVALAAIQGLSERLDDTRIALDRKEERVDALERDLDRKDERIDALERDLDRKEARIDDLEARLAALEREQDGGV